MIPSPCNFNNLHRSILKKAYRVISGTMIILNDGNQKYDYNLIKIIRFHDLYNNVIYS